MMNAILANVELYSTLAGVIGVLFTLTLIAYVKKAPAGV